MSIEQERALLPCPFCGSTNIEIQISTPDREGVPTNLMCSDCGASGPWEYEQGNSHAKADDAWNRRAALQSQDREDAERLDWLLRQLPGDAIRYCVGVIADTADIDEFREAIDHTRRVEGDGE